MLKQITMAITAAMVLATVSTGAAGAAASDGGDSGGPTERLHQHQGIGGISAPPPHHHHNHTRHRR
jgi:hypothetical protein